VTGSVQRTTCPALRDTMNAHAITWQALLKLAFGSGARLEKRNLFYITQSVTSYVDIARVSAFS